MPKEIIEKARASAEDATGAFTKLAEQACSLVESLLGTPFRVGGDLLSDQLRAWQWSNRVRIMKRAKEKLPESHRIQSVPPGFLLPFLDGAGNIDDPLLQELWAQLLAGSLQGEGSRHPMFMTTLRQLDSSDADFLTKMATGQLTIEDWRSRDEEGIAERLLTLNILAPILGAKNHSDRPDPSIYLKTVRLSEFGKQLMRQVLSPDQLEAMQEDTG
ncbi:MAG: DUF2806 domain-containing protein [Planctomycetota bacterium]